MRIEMYRCSDCGEEFLSLQSALAHEVWPHHRMGGPFLEKSPLDQDAVFVGVKEYHGDEKCVRPQRVGWKCVTAPHRAYSQAGFGSVYSSMISCGLVPRWWNWSKAARAYRRSTR